MIIKKLKPEIPSGYTGKKLLLFFAGWGMDEHPFREYAPAHGDLMIAYDYSSLSFDETLLKPYDEIRVVAWSMGVWAASQLLRDNNFPITESIAINGTHVPVDDRKGIPTSIFTGTLNALNESTLYKFRRRMCGSGDILKRFLNKAPQRDLENLRTELESIGKQSLSRPPVHFKWDNVYIGNRDKIFPFENQLNAWDGAHYTIINEAHYPEELWKKVLSQSSI